MFQIEEQKQVFTIAVSAGVTLGDKNIVEKTVAIAKEE